MALPTDIISENKRELQTTDAKLSTVQKHITAKKKEGGRKKGHTVKLEMKELYTEVINNTRKKCIRYKVSNK